MFLLHSLPTCVQQAKLSCWRVKKWIISSWATVMGLTGWSTMSVGGLITQSWILLHPMPPASCWTPKSKDGTGGVFWCYFRCNVKKKKHSIKKKKNACLAGRSSVPCSWAERGEPMLCPGPLLALKGFPSCPCDGQLAWGRLSPQAWRQSRRSLCAFRLSFKWWEQQTIRQLSSNYLALVPLRHFWRLNMRCDMHSETRTCMYFGLHKS